MAKALKIVMSGGGSGGHVFPAIAIADAIKEIVPNTEFLFIGALGKIEMTAVPKAGYPIKGLRIAGIQRRLTVKNILFPFKLVFSIIKAWFIIKSFKPDATIGTGGYASGAALKVAQWQGVPTFIQEQNAFPGITNKLLAKKVRYIFAAYPGLERFFDKDKIIISGNPLRASIHIASINKETALHHFGLVKDKHTIFVTGGSLGALAINEAIASHIDKIKENDIQVIWQCGKVYEDKYKAYETDQIKVRSFIDRMDYAYAAADIIISRAGGTISELALVGKPTILLPSPNVAEDHQTKNGMALVKQEAAILIKDQQAKDQLVPSAISLLNDKEKQNRLSRHIKSFAKPLAAKEIAQKIVESIL